jgi:phosphoserine phosphatase RsbU/P
MRTYNFIVNSSPRWPFGHPEGNPLPIRPTAPDRLTDRIRDTQLRMWPSARPVIPGLEYDTGWRRGSGHDVDYLDYFETDGGNFSLAIGDLVAGQAGGEGASGALLLSSLYAMVRSLDGPYGPSGHRGGGYPSSILGELLRTIHELFYEVSAEGSYATLFLACYDPIERRLDYCNAGHEAPVILRKSGGRRRTILLESGGPVIGVLRRSTYRQGSIRLQPGDILAAYTAGLAEICNRAGEEWGYRRMVAAIEAAVDLPAREMVRQVMAEAGDFSGGAKPASDMTLWLGRLEEALSTSVPAEAESVEVLEPAPLAA